MMNVTRRCLGSPVWPVAALLFLLPNLAQAQLFPDRTIRRVRPPCTTESPFNAQVRRDYFGYYPTCWSRFPAGWQCPCPNPELPNIAASIARDGEFGSKKLRDDRDPAPGMGEDNPDDAGSGSDPTTRIPVPNNGRSPFDIPPADTKPPGPGDDSDAFTSPRAPNPAPPAAPRTAPPASRPSAGLLDMPKVPETSPTTSYDSPLKPGSMDVAPDATLTSGMTSNLRPDLGPLPSAPVSIPNDLTSPGQTSLGQPFPTAPAPAQAPRRQSILSRLFGPRNSTNR